MERTAALTPMQRLLLRVSPQPKMEHTIKKDGSGHCGLTEYHLNPKWSTPLIHLGEVYLELGQLEKTLKYFEASMAFERTRDKTEDNPSGTGQTFTVSNSGQTKTSHAPVSSRLSLSRCMSLTMRLSEKEPPRLFSTIRTAPHPAIL